eukprot:TRINITY_DN6104_c0_g1_i15.p1 TRINITY_DN6104_c0_g1~~TRINITY_DN6104_c0_g1_i15.p1  ORF type:complete len:459 (-),score=43.48 TRINITY_DN6104_c0_g1_i15:386-1762(-)
MLIWACGKLKCYHHQFFSAFGKYRDQQNIELDCQSLTNIIWAYGTLRAKQYGKLQPYLSLIDRKFDELKVMEVCQIAWALAKLHCKRPFFFKQFGELFRTHTSDFMLQDVSNMLWSMSVLKYKDEKVIQEAIKHCRFLLDGRRNNRIFSQDLIQICIALAKIQVYDQRLFTQICSLIKSKQVQLSVRDTAEMIRALSSIRHFDDELMTFFAQYIQEHGSEVNLKDIVQIMQGYSQFDGDWDEIVCFLQIQSLQKLDNLNSMQFCQLAWSMAIMGKWDPHWWEALMKQFPEVQRKGYDQGFFSTMYHTYLIVDLAGQNQLINQYFSPEFLKESQMIWLESIKCDITQSPGQKEVASILREMGIEVEEEVIVGDKFVSVVDMVFEFEGRKIALFFDGYGHYMRSFPHSKLRRARVRDDLVKNVGYDVVIVPSSVWRKGKLVTPEQKQQCLLSTLRGESVQ